MLALITKANERKENKKNGNQPYLFSLYSNYFFN